MPATAIPAAVADLFVGTMSKPFDSKSWIPQTIETRIACASCFKAKTGCDNNRPCGRCCRLGIENCRDRRAPFAKTAVACTRCHRAKSGCESARPCARCVRLGYEDDCRDRAHKKPGRPKKENDIPFRTVREKKSPEHAAAEILRNFADVRPTSNSSRTLKRKHAQPSNAPTPPVVNHAPKRLCTAKSFPRPIDSQLTPVRSSQFPVIKNEHSANTSGGSNMCVVSTVCHVATQTTSHNGNQPKTVPRKKDSLKIHISNGKVTVKPSIRKKNTPSPLNMSIISVPSENFLPFSQSIGPYSR
eukprot:97376_1